MQCNRRHGDFNRAIILEDRACESTSSVLRGFLGVLRRADREPGLDARQQLRQIPNPLKQRRAWSVEYPRFAGRSAPLEPSGTVCFTRLSRWIPGGKSESPIQWQVMREALSDRLLGLIATNRRLHHFVHFLSLELYRWETRRVNTNSPSRIGLPAPSQNVHLTLSLD